MKKTHFVLASVLSLAASTAPAICAQNNILPDQPINIQGGPGIAVSMSSSQSELPAEAQKFLQTIYSRDAVGPVTFNAIKNQYKVVVGNGTQITFNKEGKVKDIQAPRGESLPQRAVQAVLSSKVFKHLVDANLIEDVTGIKDAGSRGMRVQLLNAMPPEMLFDIDGLFVILDD